MQRECSFVKSFHERMDFYCEDEERLCCKEMNCLCACVQVEAMFEAAREEYLDDGDYYFLTVFDELGVLALGELADFNIEASKEKTFIKLRKLCIPGFKAFGALDIELQEFIDSDRTRKSRWLLHWHFLICSDLSLEDLKKQIYGAFNAGKRKRIAKIEEVTRRPFACGYLVKRPHQFKRRLSSTSKGQRRMQLRIRGKARRELHEFLKLSSRLEWIGLIGFRRYGNRLVAI